MCCPKFASLPYQVQMLSTVEYQLDYGAELFYSRKLSLCNRYGAHKAVNQMRPPIPSGDRGCPVRKGVAPQTFTPVEMWWHTVTHGRGSEVETGEWSVYPVPFTLPRNMVYPALLPLLPLIRATRLPAVDWTDAPADLNGLLRFAERRNLVSAHVPSHFNWPVPLPPWSRVFLEELTACQLLKKLLAFYGTRRFITVLTKARQLSLFWAKTILSKPLEPHPVSWSPILFFSYHLHLGLTSGSFPFVSPTKILYALLLSPYVTNSPLISFFLVCHPNNNWWAVKITMFLGIKYPPFFLYVSPLGPNTITTKTMKQERSHSAVSWKFRIKLLNQ
jgi:hypothetical protein